jgi:putative ABC transport system permease protein
MNILKRLTIQNLKLNKKRTIVTVIGIALSISLITGVAAIAASFRRTYMTYTISNYGNYHYGFYNVSSSDLTYYENNRSIESAAVIESVGFSRIADSTERKEFLYLLSGTQSAYEKMSVQLKEGRYAEKDSEIVVSENYKNADGHAFQIGDTLTLDVIQRIEDGSTIITNDISYDDEQDVFSFKKQYTVVGTAAHSPFEASWQCGYACFTYGQQQTDPHYLVFARYTPSGLRNQYQVTGEISGIDGRLLEGFYHGNDLTKDEDAQLAEAEQSHGGRLPAQNENLIECETLISAGSTISVIYEIAAVVILIIMVTSIYCIKNSFDISITERIHQYGILRSIGATRKQIKKSVLYEAFILSLIGIPFGICLGLFFNIILVHYSGVFLANVSEITMQYDAPPLILLLSAFIGLITVILSAARSARKANRIEPITAIRGNEEIKTGRKPIRTPHYIHKLFGISGVVAYKNTKRDKRKYRTTVVSIVLCTATYISLSYIMNTAFEAVSYRYRSKNFNITASYYNYSGTEYQSNINQILSTLDQEEYSMCMSKAVYGQNMKLAGAYKDYLGKSVAEDDQYIDLVILDDHSYQEYLSKLGLKEADVKDRAVLLNKAYVTVNQTTKELQKTDYAAGDIISGRKASSYGNVYQNDVSTVYSEDMTIQLAAVTADAPACYTDTLSSISLVVPSSYMDQIQVVTSFRFSINASNAEDTMTSLKQLNITNLGLTSLEEEQRYSNSLFMMLSVFLYGFIAVIASIGITSIINTISSNMELRQKEFASLKSIGMTTHEFNQMVSLESVLYGTKSLMIGIPLGIFLSLAMYMIFRQSWDISYLFPWKGVLISTAAVTILLLSTMKLSITKIGRQNIIETIRSENI